MISRWGRLGGIVIGWAAALVGCASPPPPLPPACGASSAAVERALAGAPGPVRLSGGALISDCLRRVRGDVELQQVGSVLSGAADRLAARALADPRAALELGFLVGAARRGASQTNGVASQLEQRIESAAALRTAGPAPLAALHRGILAGRSTG